MFLRRFNKNYLAPKILSILSSVNDYLQVNEAEKDRLESEAEHRKMTAKFKVAQDVVQKLQQELKRTINKSK